MMNKINFPKIGLRNIKTAMAVLICLVLYHAAGLLLNFERSPVFASIAAIISMQNNMESSISMGANRVIGTVMGGAIGILFVFSKYIYYNIWLHFLLIAAGIIVVIYLNVLIKRRDSVSISCVVFLIIMINAESFMDRVPVIPVRGIQRNSIPVFPVKAFPGLLAIWMSLN